MTKPVDPDKMRPYSKRPHKNPQSHKRTNAEMLKDRIDIARLYLQGYTQTYISHWMSENRDYTLGYNQVSSDIKKIQQEWRDQYLPDIDMMKAAELARLDVLIQEAFKGWYDSRKDKETSESEHKEEKAALTEKELANTRPFYQETKSKLKTEGRDGSYKFLELIDKFIARRCKILGLDAPTVHEVKDWRKAAEQAGFNASEEFEEMVNALVESDTEEQEEPIDDEPEQDSDS